MMPPFAFKFIKGHNSRSIRVTLPKFILDLSLHGTFLINKHCA